MSITLERTEPFALTDKDQIIAALEKKLGEKDHEIQQLHAYQDKMHATLTNKDMTYADRVMWMITLKNHSHEILALKPFQPNVSRLRQESGLSPDSATKFFASMQEAKAIKYANKPQQDEGHNYTSVSMITPLEGHAQANTRAATLRIKQRTETTKRRIARKLLIQPCEECGSTDQAHAYSAIVPLCKNCNHVTMALQETVLAKNVRIIEEEVIQPDASHEFSEVTDYEYEEWDEDDDTNHEQAEAQANSSTEASDTSHEFSEVTNPNQEDKNASHEFSEAQISIPAETTPTSHEFSEGMTVETPRGIGTISLISCIYNRMRCRVRFTEIQADGTYYAAFDLSEIQPVIQSSLLKEGR